MKKIQAKPFSTDFDEQLDAAEALYGVQVQFDFSMKDLENEITRLIYDKGNNLRCVICTLFTGQPVRRVFLYLF